jgi:hypothetical protein
MLHNKSIAFQNDIIGFLLEIDHWRKISRDCVGSPHLGMNHSVDGIAEELTGFQASQRVFSVG